MKAIQEYDSASCTKLMLHIVEPRAFKGGDHRFLVLAPLVALSPVVLDDAGDAAHM